MVSFDRILANLKEVTASRPPVVGGAESEEEMDLSQAQKPTKAKKKVRLTLPCMSVSKHGTIRACMCVLLFTSTPDSGIDKL